MCYTLDTDKDLLQHQGVSEREAAQAQSDAAAAEASRAAALQTLTSLNVDPGTIKAIEHGGTMRNYGGIIRAPISGYVGRSQISQGALVTAYQQAPLAVVEAINPIYVDVGVLPGLLATLKERLADAGRKGTPATHVKLKFEDGALYPRFGRV